MRVPSRASAALIASAGFQLCLYLTKLAGGESLTGLMVIILIAIPVFAFLSKCPKSEKAIVIPIVLVLLAPSSFECFVWLTFQIAGFAP
jgi:hypothetical protein